MNSKINFTDSSWVPVRPDSDFSLMNIPFGIGIINGNAQVCTRIGDSIVGLATWHERGLISIDGLTGNSLSSDSLNEFIRLGKAVTVPVRERLIELLHESDPENLKESGADLLEDAANVEMILPVEIGDYTDFYSSREHATNVGTMFRDPNNALLPNWLHLPVGYHGRASSIVVSGTDIHRPKGQTRPDPEAPPVYGPCKLMDLELEMAFVVGKDNALGQPIEVSKAEEHIFGLALFNDWSARDIQKWEYVPLGPFLGKNFASTLSPWIVTLEALEPFRIPSPKQDPEVLPYLSDVKDAKRSYDIDLFVDLHTEAGDVTTICKSNFQYMYWTMVQQLAHHTVNGCNMRVGDVCASGTISGKTEDSYGSMLELSWRGTKPVQLNDGTERKFIKDGDSISLRGFGEKDGVRVGFGECIGKILPSI